ncbi:MAG: hypothetical protein ACAI38_02135 [Myxococcota bacterium]
MITIRISGELAAADAVTFNERAMGEVGQGAPTMVLTAPYQSFAERFAPIYAEAITELETDDRVTGKFSPPYAGATRYPSLAELFALADSERMEMIGAFFAVDILRLFLPETAAGARWAVRSVDSVAKKGDLLELRGVVEEI